jgi:antitoxin YefM
MTTLPLAEARNRLSEIVTEAETTHERYEITRNGRAAAVLLASDDYEALRETIAVLSDGELLNDIRAGLTALDEGDHVDEEQLRTMMRRNRRHQ